MRLLHEYTLLAVSLRNKMLYFYADELDRKANSENCSTAGTRTGRHRLRGGKYTIFSCMHRNDDFARSLSSKMVLYGIYWTNYPLFTPYIALLALNFTITVEATSQTCSFHASSLATLFVRSGYRDYSMGFLDV